MRTIPALLGHLALLPPRDGASTLRAVSDFPAGSAKVDDRELGETLERYQHESPRK